MSDEDFQPRPQVLQVIARPPCPVWEDGVHCFVQVVTEEK